MTELKAGRELDALVAEKVMGWEMRPAPFGLAQKEIYQCWHEGNHVFCTIHMFKPSTDIAAANLVREKLARAGKQFWSVLPNPTPYDISLAALKAVGAV